MKKCQDKSDHWLRLLGWQDDIYEEACIYAEEQAKAEREAEDQAEADLNGRKKTQTDRA